MHLRPSPAPGIAISVTQKFCNDESNPTAGSQ
jgi:hypothetical protein